MTVKYPNIVVKLTGHDGNAFAILARVTKAMIRHGVADEDVRAVRDEAMRGDHDHLLQTAMNWVDIT